MNTRGNFLAGLYLSVGIIQSMQSSIYWTEYRLGNALRLPPPMAFYGTAVFAVASGLVWPISVPAMVIHYHYFVPEERKRLD